MPFTSKEESISSAAADAFGAADAQAVRPVTLMFWKRKQAQEPPTPAKPLHRCSFCNKSQRDVPKLIAGPRVNICSECVDICRGVLAQDHVLDPGKSQLELDREEALSDRGEAVLCGLCDNLTELKLMIRVPERGWVCQRCVDAIRAVVPGQIQ
jgi:hypothetical protein